MWNQCSLRSRKFVMEDKGRTSRAPSSHAPSEVRVVPFSTVDVPLARARACTGAPVGVQLHPVTVVCNLWRAKSAFPTSTNTHKHTSVTHYSDVFGCRRVWEELEDYAGYTLGAVYLPRIWRLILIWPRLMRLHATLSSAKQSSWDGLRVYVCGVPGERVCSHVCFSVCVSVCVIGVHILIESARNIFIRCPGCSI